MTEINVDQSTLQDSIYTHAESVRKSHKAIENSKPTAVATSDVKKTKQPTTTSKTQKSPKQSLNRDVIQQSTAPVADINPSNGTGVDAIHLPKPKGLPTFLEKYWSGGATSLIAVMLEAIGTITFKNNAFTVDMTMNSASTANNQFSLQVQSAQFQYRSDMNQAHADIVSGAIGIAGGAFSIFCAGMSAGLASKLLSTASDLADSVATQFPALASAVSAAGAAIAPVVDVITAITNKLSDLADTAMQKISQAASDTVNAAMAKLTQVLTSVVGQDTLTTIATKVESLSGSFENLVNQVFAPIENAAPKALQSTIAAAKSSILSLGNKLISMTGVVAKATAFIAQPAIDALTNLANYTNTLATQFANATGLTSAVQSVTDSQFATDFAKGWTNYANEFSQKWTGYVSQLSEKLFGAPQDIELQDVASFGKDSDVADAADSAEGTTSSVPGFGVGNAIDEAQTAAEEGTITSNGQKVESVAEEKVGALEKIVKQAQESRPLPSAFSDADYADADSQINDSPDVASADGTTVLKETQFSKPLMADDENIHYSDSDSQFNDSPDIDSTSSTNAENNTTSSTAGAAKSGETATANAPNDNEVNGDNYNKKENVKTAFDHKLKLWDTMGQAAGAIGNGVSSTISGSMYENAKAMQSYLSGVAQAASSLAQNAYQMTQNTLGSVSKVSDALQQTREQVLQYVASIAQSMRG